MQKQDNLSRAKRQVENIKGFYIHLAVFVPVIALLFVINAATGPEWWAQWPFLGWGAGILGHAFAVFGGSPGIVARWEQQKIDAVKRSLDAKEPVAGEMPKPVVTAATELPPVDRPAS